MYNAITSQGGANANGMIYSLYFIILVLFGNCNKLFDMFYNSHNNSSLIRYFT